MLAIEPHIGTGEAAKRLGVSRRTILRWVKEGRLRAHSTPTNRNRVLLADVEQLEARFAAEQRRQAGAA